MKRSSRPAGAVLLLAGGALAACRGDHAPAREHLRDPAPVTSPAPTAQAHTQDMSTSLSEGMRQLQRVTATLDGMPAGDSDLRPQPADTMPGAPAETSIPTPPGAVPLVQGLTLVSALHFPGGDRENVVQVSGVTTEGVTYAWSFRERTSSGDSIERRAFRFVSASDLASAPRYNGVFRERKLEETPGYTAFTISRAAYDQVLKTGEIRFAVTSLDAGPLAALQSAVSAAAPVDLTSSRVTLRGTLSLAAPTPERMPMLLDGQRVSLPALHLRGRFAMQDRHEDSEYWVLADTAHPLILRIVTGDQVLQTVRIDRPGGLELHSVEGDLERSCRVELPGVYFGFASAELEPASNPALAGVAALLKRHTDWSLVVEGHTDSIGDEASNLALSTRRADAVRTALVSRYGVGSGRLSSKGFGESRPRESNATLEGRARNRRVELSRACTGNSP